MISYRVFSVKVFFNPFFSQQDKMEMVPNESSAALLPDEEVVREGILDNRPRTMSAPLESEEFVTFEVKINGERAGRLKSVSIQDGGARFSHAPVIYPRSVWDTSPPPDRETPFYL